MVNSYQKLMLAGDFFDIKAVEPFDLVAEQQQIKAIVLLNADHSIYQGHFPGNPVVPGVCQIQMIKELLELVLLRSTRLMESDNIKFLSMINPRNIELLNVDLLIKHTDPKHFSVTASVYSGTATFLKFKGKFESAS